MDFDGNGVRFYIFGLFLKRLKQSVLSLIEGSGRPTCMWPLALSRAHRAHIEWVRPFGLKGGCRPFDTFFRFAQKYSGQTATFYTEDLFLKNSSLFEFQKKSIFGLFLLLMMPDCFTLSIGSNTAVARQALATFPAVDADNTMLGFSAFESGYTLQSSVTTCTFNSLFHVSGPITMNQGRIFLNKDMRLENKVTLVNGGRFTGNSFCIDFPEIQNAVFKFPSSSVPASCTCVFDTITLRFNSLVQLCGSCRFNGTCKIDGRGNTLDLRDGGSLVARPGSVLTFDNVRIIGVSSQNIACLNDTASLVFRDCELVLTQDVTFSRGSFLIQNDVMIQGTVKFNFASGLTSTISSQSTLYFDQGMTFSYSPRLPNKNLLYFTDQTSGLYLNGSTFVSTRTGLMISAGTIYLDNDVTFTSQARNRAEGIELATTANMILLSKANVNIYGFFRAW